MKIYKLLILGFFMTLSFGKSNVAMATAGDLRPAQMAADRWLKLIDSGQIEESWKQSAELFQHKVSSVEWQDDLQKARDPFGKLIKRQLVSAKAIKSVPGAPDGRYVILQFNTVFENKKEAVETVTPMLDKDGQWRVSGYYIK